MDVVLFFFVIYIYIITYYKYIVYVYIYILYILYIYTYHVYVNIYIYMFCLKYIGWFQTHKIHTHTHTHTPQTNMSPEEGDTAQKEKASNFQPQFLRGPLDVSCPGRQVCCLFLVETSRISYRLMVQKSLLTTTWDGARTVNNEEFKLPLPQLVSWVERRISGCHQRYQHLFEHHLRWWSRKTVDTMKVQDRHCKSLR